MSLCAGSYSLRTSITSLCDALLRRQLGPGALPHARPLHLTPVRSLSTLTRELGISGAKSRSRPNHPRSRAAGGRARPANTAHNAAAGRLHAPAAAAAPNQMTEECPAAAEQQQPPQPQQSIEEAYEQQLQGKISHVRQLFTGFNLPEFEVFRSAPQHYRLRAEFRVWHKDEDSYYIMFNKVPGQTKPQQYRVDTFPRGSVLMNELMTLLMQRVFEVPALRNKLYQANFHTTLSGQAMVTLVYHRPIDVAWEAAAKDLRKHLAQAPSCRTEEVVVIGRSRKRKLELDCSYVTEHLTVGDNEYTFRQVEGAFSQPNGSICQQMLGWAQGVTASSQSFDLLELYCGNANFTVPLAANFRKVIATEVSKASVETGHHNLKVNGVQNVIIGRMSSEEFTEAWHKKREMRRLEGLKWDEVDLQTILVDPPRAGLDCETVQLLKEFANVVYISCNPNTLAENLEQVRDTHDIKRFAIFDQFPGTEHLECGAFLQRKPGAAALAAANTAAAEQTPANAVADSQTDDPQTAAAGQEAKET